MKNLTPIPRDQRPPIPDFTPVPRLKPRHDGWTPQRQRAFIEALADTGSVSTACRMVNMASEGAYALRRHPDAGEFRRAWEAALDMGVMRLKDEAFERAINGQLVPVFVGGKLLGFRRKRNDRLLMFCLRHYGQDQQGRRVTINYFSNRATAGATNLPLSACGDRVGESGLETEHPALPLAQATTTTMTTTISGSAADRTGRDDAAARTLAAFEGVDLDPQAQSEILAILESCAARQRAIDPEDDLRRAFVGVDEAGDYAGELESGAIIEEREPLNPGEVSWEILDDKATLAAIDTAAAAIAARKNLPAEQRETLRRAEAAESERQRRANKYDLDRDIAKFRRSRGEK